jgi:hypothetical protein
MRTSENPHYEYFIDGTSANRPSPKFALTRFSEVRLQLVRSFEKSKKGVRPLKIHPEFIAVWLHTDGILLKERIYEGRGEHGGYGKVPQSLSCAA